MSDPLETIQKSRIIEYIYTQKKRGMNTEIRSEKDIVQKLLNKNPFNGKNPCKGIVKLGRAIIGLPK